MWLSLILLVLLFAITVFQSKQGLFGAFLMTMLTLCCAATALGTYEWVAVSWLAPLWQPDYAHAIALSVTFGVPLLILRLVFDRLTRRACPLPSWADRVGSGVCALVTGFIVVGMLALAVKMIPFGGSIIGHTPVVTSPQPRDRNANTKPPKMEDENRDIWLWPDRFTVRAASVLSDGIFSGARSFHESNPDLVQAVAWGGAPPSEVAHFAPPRAITFVRTALVQFVYRLAPGESEGQASTYEPEGPKGGMEFRAVRVQLQNTARDTRRTFTFALRQFRLVGQTRGDGAYEQFYPVAIQDTTDLTRHIRYLKQNNEFWPVVDDLYVPLGDDRQVEMVFELPEGFRPDFLEFRRGARVAVPLDVTAAGRPEAGARRQPAERTASAEQPPGEPAGEPGEESASQSGRRSRAPRAEPDTSGSRGRRTRGVAAMQEGSRFSDELPMTMTSYQQGTNTEISGGALVNGRLAGDVDRQSHGSDSPVSKFAVPPDKRLLQLNSERLQARSGLGRAMSQAVTTVQNYIVQDANGRQYKIVGKYAIADVGGRSVIEIQYFSEESGSIGGLGAFEQVNESDLKPEDQFVLLFLVDPGARIASFSTGGTASRSDDLTDQNLTAPP